MMSELLSNFEADARDFPDLMVVDERSDVIPFIVCSRVWR
jgi:hypothetical protein